MTKLTKTQDELLRAAVDADCGSVAAPGDSKSASALIKKGLVISAPQPEGGSRLMITESGRMAIGHRNSEHSPGQTAISQSQAPLMPTAAPTGKIGMLVELLRRADGATIAAMMSATGWQAHSVRGAMSGSVKKALGLNVVSEKTDAGRTYRIVEGAST